MCVIEVTTLPTVSAQVQGRRVPEVKVTGGRRATSSLDPRSLELDLAQPFVLHRFARRHSLGRVPALNRSGHGSR